MARASIIIPVYNKEKYLVETLQSVDRQTENDLEVIIIDDKSTDHSMDRILDFKNSTEKQVRVFQNDKNMGVAYSRNLGMEEAKADYIAFLDADDLLDRDFMKVMLLKAKYYPNADYIYGLHVPFKKEIRLREVHLISNYFSDYDENKLIYPKIDFDYIRRSDVSCNARLYQKGSIQNLKFIESHFEDYEFFLDTVAEQLNCIYTTQPIYGYRITKTGKYQTSIENIKSMTDYFDIYERVVAKHPNMDDEIYKLITERQIAICVGYLQKIVSNVILKPKDLVTLVRNYNRYLNVRYGYCNEEDPELLSEIQKLPTNPETLRKNIKKIVMKY